MSDIETIIGEVSRALAPSTSASLGDLVALLTAVIPLLEMSIRQEVAREIDGLREVALGYDDVRGVMAYQRAIWLITGGRRS